MTRRKRTPDPEPPRKRVAFHIPQSLAQLSALSRSLVQRTDASVKVDKEKGNSDVVARAQALSHSPQPEAQSARPIRWKHDQKDFPNAQTWVQPTSNPGARSHAKSAEHQAMEVARQANMISSSSSRPTHPFMPHPSGNQNSAVRQSMQQEGYHRTVNLTPEAESHVDLEAASHPNKKLKMTDSVSGGEVDLSRSHPIPTSDVKDLPTASERNLDEMRQATIAQLMKTGPVSVSSAPGSIQIPAKPHPVSTVPLQPQPEANHAPEAIVEPSEVLELSKHSSQIEALIAKKRLENAATGHLHKLKTLQAEHRRKGPGPRPWSGVVSPFPHLTNPTYSPLPHWPPSPSPAPVQPSTAPVQSQQAPGYAEAPTVEEDTDLDLRSLFSSRAPSPHSQQPNGDEETAQALQQAIRDPADSTERPASPSAQLLSNLANVSSNALAQLQSPQPHPPQPSQQPHPSHPPQQRHPQLQQPPAPFPPPGPQRIYRKQKRQYLVHSDIPTPTPPDPSSNHKPLTPQQQEMKLFQQQTERSQYEARMLQLRTIAEQRARLVQMENARRSEEAAQQQEQKNQEQIASAGAGVSGLESKPAETSTLSRSNGVVESAPTHTPTSTTTTAPSIRSENTTGNPPSAYPPLLPTPTAPSLQDTVIFVPQRVGQYIQGRRSLSSSSSGPVVPPRNYNATSSNTINNNFNPSAARAQGFYQSFNSSSSGARSSTVTSSGGMAMNTHMGMPMSMTMNPNMQARFRNASVQGFEVPKR